MLVAPVLQVDPEAVLSLGAQLVDVFVAQPELRVQVAETVPVVPPVPVKAHRPVDTPLDHGPAATWGCRRSFTLSGNGPMWGVQHDRSWSWSKPIVLSRLTIRVHVTVNLQRHGGQRWDNGVEPRPSDSVVIDGGAVDGTAPHVLNI